MTQKPADTPRRRPRSLPEWRNDTSGPWMTVPALCSFLNLGESQAHKLLDSGAIACVRIGRSKRAVTESAIAWQNRLIEAAKKSAAA